MTTRCLLVKFKMLEIKVLQFKGLQVHFLLLKEPPHLVLHSNYHQKPSSYPYHIRQDQTLCLSLLVRCWIFTHQFLKFLKFYQSCLFTAFIQLFQSPYSLFQYPFTSLLIIPFLPFFTLLIQIPIVSLTQSIIHVFKFEHLQALQIKNCKLFQNRPSQIHVALLPNQRLDQESRVFVSKPWIECSS